MENEKKDYILPASIIVGAILISGSIIYLIGTSGNAPGGATGNNPAVVSEELKNTTSRDVVLGDPKAPVAMIEYGDYQCPYCARFFQTTEQAVKENYVKPGKVKMVFRNFQFLGVESELAGQAAECAKDQGNFWAYHDAIYQVEARDGRENNGNLNRSLFLQLAKDVGLDAAAFTSCYDSGKYADRVKKDTSDAAALGIKSTPTTFVNGQIVLGLVPYEQFAPIVENALKATSK